MIFRIAIMDDILADASYNATQVNIWAAHEGHAVLVEAFSSAEAFLFRWAEEKAFDILLFDIEMPGMDGVTLARRVRSENRNAQIVFVTGYADYILEGYEVEALHYLMKPVDPKKLSAVLNKAVRNLDKKDRTFVFGANGGTVRLEANEIIMVESFAHSCVIATAHDHIGVKTGISELEKLLGEGFVRCHRSYIVGIRYIRSISRVEIMLDDGQKIPLSRRNYEAVNQAFIRHFRGN